MDPKTLDPTLSGAQMLGFELNQRRETGYDTSAVERALSLLPDDAAEPSSWNLFAKLADSPRDPDWAHEEPSARADIVAALPPALERSQAWSSEHLHDRVLGGWLGRIAGCNLGKPVENGAHWTRARIRTYLESVNAYPLLDYIPKAGDDSEEFQFLPNWTETTLGRVSGSARDDDLDFSILGLHILERWGREYTSQDVAHEWLFTLPMLQTRCERVAIRNIVAGLRPPETATHRNPFREWVGAQIRGDVHGWTNPGEPRSAALQSMADAMVSHTDNGVYGEMWVAALVASAFSAEDARVAVLASLEHVPPRSRLAAAVRSVVGWYDGGLSWDEALDRIDAEYGHYHWMHCVNNSAAVTAGLLWAEGDFSAAVGLTVQAGMDTGSNGATAGSVAGVLAGASKIPEHWVNPLEDRIATAVFGYDNVRISELAKRTVAFALAQPLPRGVNVSELERRWLEAGPRPSPRDTLQAEIAQRRESGHDTSQVESALAVLPEDAGSEAFWNLYEELAESPRLPEWAYGEPSFPEEILATLPATEKPSRKWAPETLSDQILGGWLGRIAGCNLGKPVEYGDHWTRAHIRSYLELVDAYPLRDYIPKYDELPEYQFRENWPETTRGRVSGSARDDDIDYPILALHVLERYGREYTSSDVAIEWLHLLPYFQTYTAEQETMRNLIGNVWPPQAAMLRNPYREWIGAQIRADVHGWTNPGDPRAAALQTMADATLSHTGNGIYGEMWSAAMIASAFTASDAHAAILASLDHIPPRSRLFEAVRAVMGWYEEGLTWDEALDRIEAAYGHYNWVHTINNAAAVTAGLLWAEGDFSAAVGLTVQAGLDTDSNGATAGSVAGVLAGAAAIPRHWVAPLEDRVATAVFGYDNVRISDLARRTLEFTLAGTASDAAPARP